MPVVKRKNLLSLAVVLGLAAWGTSPALAQDEAPTPAPSSSGSKGTADDDADLAVKLPNHIGLSGFQDMIDARIPEGLVIRGGLRMEQSSESLHGHLMELNKDRFDLQAYAGVAALSLVEAGARLPFELDHTTKGFKVNGGHTRHSGDAVGDLDIGGKISLRLGPVALAPYAQGTLPSGDRKFNHASGGDVGGAATISLLHSRFNVHANAAAAFHEKEWYLRWRFGVSFVPLASKVLLLRPYGYVDGRQLIHGETGQDMRVVFGAQALLLDFLTVDMGGSYRFLSDATPKGLGDDRGTWAFEVGAGVAF